MNEFELIARLTQSLPTNPFVVTGAGDDCAVLDFGLPDQWLLFKTDAIVEGVHFTKETPPENQFAVTLLAGTKSWGMRIYLGAFAVVLAPVAEEFIFRGMLYPFVKQLGWPRLAWFGVSFVFALIHDDAATFVPLFVLALALTWLYEKTDNLLAPIAAHSLFNAANLVLLCFEEPVNQFLQKYEHALHLT